MRILRVDVASLEIHRKLQNLRNDQIHSNYSDKKVDITFQNTFPLPIRLEALHHLESRKLTGTVVDIIEFEIEISYVIFLMSLVFIVTRWGSIREAKSR